MPVSFPLPPAVDISTLIDAINQMFADGPLPSSQQLISVNTLYAPAQAQQALLLVNTTNPVTITLDSTTPVNTRVIVKDITGLAGTNNITLHANGGVAIDGVVADIAVNINWGGFAVVRTASGWATVGRIVNAGPVLEPIMIMERVITADVSIPVGMNALSAGPVSIAPGVTVTVPPGSRWAVI